VQVSVIVVAEPDTFAHKERNFFASFEAQTYPRDGFELILVDGSSNPATAAAFAAFRARCPDLSATLLQGTSTARAAGNNLAAVRAGGGLLIFLADDFDPAPGLVAAHAGYHALNPDIDAAGIGTGLFPEHLRQDFFVRWMEDSGGIFGAKLRGPLAIWPKQYFHVGNASIKKSKFDALGGFDERFPYDAWDDYEFGLRWAASGGYSQFIAGAIAIHRHAVSLEERCATMVRAGESARVLEQLHPDQEHAWRAMLQRGAQPALPVPPRDAPAHVWIAYYSGQLDAAFRRGYLAALARSMASWPAHADAG